MKGPIVWALLVVCDCVLAQPVFNRGDAMVGVHPHAVATGDFDGDHGDDIAVITEEGLFTMLNRGYTSWRPVRTQVSVSDLVTGFYAPFVGTADFNRDGLDDIVTNGVLLLSRGDGSFRIARRDLAIVVGTGDFNGDGKVDLLQSDPDFAGPGRSVRVQLGNGDATFRPGATITTVSVEQVVVADFNHDGRPDVAVVPHTGEPLLVFLGQGNGAFGPAIQTQIPFGLQWMYLVGDFNGDGIPDVTAPGGIALGNGDGTFQPPIPYPQSRVGVPIAIADFQRDGRIDLVKSDLMGSVFLFPGNGDGTLQSPRAQSLGWGVMPRAAVVDVEYPYVYDRRGDHADLITTSYASNSITILLYWGEAAGTGLQRAVSAASGTAIVAPGSLATLFGPTPTTGTVSAAPPWPEKLGGLTLNVEGRPARLLYVSPTQINFQVPLDFRPIDYGFWNLRIVDESGKTYDVGGINVTSVAPGLFLAAYNYGPPAGNAIRVEPDGTQVSMPLYVCASSGAGVSCDLAPIPLSTAGERPIYLSFFGTGFHGATTANVTCEINGVQVPVIYAGPQETPGVDQINVRLLPEVLDGYVGETMPVVIRIDGVPANSTFIAVR